jgi:PAS domain S-box-containing protein
VTTAQSPDRIIERASEPALIIDPAGDRFLAANEAASAMLGYAREQLLATPVSSIHRGELAQLQAVVAEVLRFGHVTTTTLTYRTVSGECLPVAISLSAFEGDRRILVIGLVHDRSEHRRA